MTRNHYRQEKFSQLHRELHRLQDITRSLVLQGVHEDTPEQYPLDLNQLYRHELELYEDEPFFKHQVTGEFHFQDALPLLPGHYIDFSQSFRNLVDNSLEAMARKNRRLLTVVTACRDRRIMLRIGDTGGRVSRRSLYPGVLPSLSSLPGKAPAGAGLAWGCSWCAGSWPPIRLRSGWTAIPAGRG